MKFPDQVIFLSVFQILCSHETSGPSHGQALRIFIHSKSLGKTRCRTAATPNQFDVIHIHRYLGAFPCPAKFLCPIFSASLGFYHPNFHITGQRPTRSNVTVFVNVSHGPYGSMWHSFSSLTLASVLSMTWDETGE